MTKSCVFMMLVSISLLSVFQAGLYVSLSARNSDPLQNICSPMWSSSPSFLACSEVLKSPSNTRFLAMGICEMVSSSSSHACCLGMSGV